MPSPTRGEGAATTTALAARKDRRAVISAPHDNHIGPATRRRLAAFAHTLRDNGFKVGLAETRDALSVLASPAAARPSSFKPALRALFCATHSDWEKFDEIFEAFWRARDMRSRQTLSGVP